MIILFFFFNDTATTEIYTLSLHDALPIYTHSQGALLFDFILLALILTAFFIGRLLLEYIMDSMALESRSEEHTSELQSLAYLVCRLLLEKKKILYVLTQSHTLIARAMIAD